MTDSTQNTGQPSTPPTGQPSTSTPAGVAPAAQSPAPNGDMQAMLSLLSELKSEIDTLKAGRVEPKVEPKPSVPAGAPEWAGAILEKLNRLEADKAAGELRSKKQTISSSVLANIPEPNRGAAELALRGLLADTNVGPDTDAVTLANTLGTQLRVAAPQLYQLPGSSRPAMQAGPDGKPDWSQVRSFDDIPPSLIADTPMEVVARIRAGADAMGPKSTIPQPLFRVSTRKN